MTQGMSIIEERLRGTTLSKTHFLRLSKEQMTELHSITRQLVAGHLDPFVTESFWIASLSQTAVADKMKSLGVRDEIAYVCWCSFGEGIAIQWNLFLAHFDDLWFPSSDDVVISSATRSWVLEITHEETVRFFRLDKEGS
jgi:hypothetical protein